MRTVRSKFGDVWRVTAHVNVQNVQVKFTNMMVESSIISATTYQGRWMACQLVWYLAERTGGVNLLIKLVETKHLF